MPVIPMSNDSQILIAGSPVPIASASKAAGMAGALSDFGDTIAKVGQALGQANRQAYERKQKLDIEEASNTYAERLTLAQMQLQNEPLIEDDVDGTKTYGAFRDRMREPMQQISETIADPETRRAFLAQAEKMSQSQALHVYADMTKRRLKQNEQQFTRIMGSYSNSARVNPEALDDVLGKMEISVRQDPDLTDDAKATILENGRKDLAFAAFNGMVDRAADGNGDFSSARKFLDERGGEFFSSEKLVQYVDQVRRGEDQYVAKLVREENRAEASARRAMRKTTDEAIQRFEAVKLNGSAGEVLAAQADLEADAAAGLLDISRVQRVVRSRDNKKAINNAFVADVSARAVQDILSNGGGNYAEIVGEIDAMEQKGFIDQEHLAIKTKLESLRVNLQEPEYANKVRQAVDAIEAHSTPIFGSAASQLDQNNRKQRILSDFYMGLSSSLSKPDPIALARGVMVRAGISFNAAPVDSGAESASALDEQLKATYKQWKRERSSGATTPEGEKVFQQRVNELYQKKKSLELKGQ